MNHILQPNLPKNKVSVFIADAFIPDAIVLPPPEIGILPESLRLHADLGITLIAGKKAVCPPETYYYYKKMLLPYGFEIIEGKSHIGCNYPEDSAYNVGIVGNKCFLNKSVCDEKLYDILICEGYEIVPVKQGYTKCSICPIDENTFITGDKGIYEAGKKAGLTVLLISNDGIKLPGYENGFWGGSCGMGDKDVLLVNGEIETMKDGKLIKDFLDERNIRIKNLKKGEVTDIGSILPLMTT